METDQKNCMKVWDKMGDFIYNYCTDFCVNMCQLLGVDYYTFGSLFFGVFMNGVIVLLLLVNLLIKIWDLYKSKVGGY